jgi:transcription elongation factor/antiterminator RfaH
LRGAAGRAKEGIDIQPMEPTEDKRLKRQWYVLHTRSRHESVVADQLDRKSLEVFLPKVKVPSRRRDRRIMIQVPLFPGYLFIRTDLHPHHHLEIVKTAGAVKLIGSHFGPVPVADQTVDSLKIMVAAEAPVFTGHRLQPGERVLVVSGPFAGVKGTFLRYRGQGRVVVNIEALGQFAGVDVLEEDVERLPPILS